MRILLIEDEAEITRPLSLALKAVGHIVDIAQDGERGYNLASMGQHDLLILDYNLPKLNGREIVNQLRGAGIRTPILMLTVHSEITDKIDLLNLGADDYLTKPFATSELLARVKALLRRPKSWQNNILQFGSLELNHDRFSLVKNGEKIALSAKEFSLLELLMKNPGRILTRQEIMENVWDENGDPFSNTIEVHIMNLRKKLETKKERFIFTIPNRGYKIDK